MAIKNRLEDRRSFDELTKLMEGVANFDFFDLKQRCVAQHAAMWSCHGCSLALRFLHTSHVHLFTALLVTVRTSTSGWYASEGRVVVGEMACCAHLCIPMQ